MDVDFDAPSVTLEDGRVIYGDFVLRADGTKSMVRQRMMGDRKKDPKPISDCGYRLILPRTALEEDEELRGMLNSPAGQ